MTVSTPPVGARILFHRKLRGLTQDQLGEAVGIDAKSVGRIERGTFFPSLETLFKLADVLHVQPAQLLTNDQIDQMDSVRIEVIKYVMQADQETLNRVLGILRR